MSVFIFSRQFHSLYLNDNLNKTFWPESKIKCISLLWSDKSFLLTMKYLKLCNIKTYFWYLNLNPILVNGVCELFVQIIQVEPNKFWGKDFRIFPNGQCWFKRHTLDAFLTLIHNRINFVCISLNKFGMRCRMQTDTISTVHTGAQFVILLTSFCTSQWPLCLNNNVWVRINFRMFVWNWGSRKHFCWPAQAPLFSGFQSRRVRKTHK